MRPSWSWLFRYDTSTTSTSSLKVPAAVTGEMLGKNTIGHDKKNRKTLLQLAQGVKVYAFFLLGWTKTDPQLRDLTLFCVNNDLINVLFSFKIIDIVKDHHQESISKSSPSVCSYSLVSNIYKWIQSQTNASKDWYDELLELDGIDVWNCVTT